jgi:hypothetical protein
VADPVTVIHDTGEDDVQAHPGCVVTVTVPVPPAAGIVPATRVTANVHDAPACVTVNVLPAMVSVPVRDADPVFGATVYVTEPLPLPAAPALIVIHVAALVAVHPQPDAAVTPTVPVTPAATTFADAVEIVGAHRVPNCVTVNVDPAIVSVPVRLAEPGLGATLNVTARDPEPDDPAVIVIHATLLTAVHAQPAPTVTVLLPVPAAAATDWDVGEMEGAHGTPNANVLDRALSVLPPGPTATTTDS